MICPEADHFYFDRYHYTTQYQENGTPRFFKEATIEARFKFGVYNSGYFGWGDYSNNVGIEFTTIGFNLPKLIAGNTQIEFTTDPGLGDYHTYKIIRTSNLIEAYVDGSKKAIVEIIDGDSLNRSSCNFDANNMPCANKIVRIK